MKNKLLLTLVIMIVTTSAFTQNIRLNAYAIGVFDDRVDSYYDPTAYYEGTVNGGLQWGGSLEFMARENYGIELLYLRQDTKAPLTYYDNTGINPGVKYTEFDLANNYVMLGGNGYLRRPGSKAEGFFGLMLGANFMGLDNPDNGNSGSKTFFAWGIKGGANLWMSPKVGIKLQAQLLSSVQSVGGGFYFGTGGAGVGAVSYSSLYQFGLGGGLVFNLGK